MHLMDFELQYQRPMLSIVEEKLFSILLGEARSRLLLHLLKAVVEVAGSSREANKPGYNEHSMF